MSKRPGFGILTAIPSPQVYCSSGLFSSSNTLQKSLQENSSKSWNVVQTAVRQEDEVYASLHLKGWQVYLPTVRRINIHKRQKRIYDDALFPGYVFIASNLGKGEFRECLGDKFGRLCSITEQEQEELGSRLISLSKVLEAGNSFRITRRHLKGRKVEVRRGPLKGVCGRVIRSKGSLRQRLLIWVQFIESGIQLDISADDIEVIDY